MPHREKNSVRDKVIGKKWIYLEKNIPQTEPGPSQGEKRHLGVGLSGFIVVGNFIG